MMKKHLFQLSVVLLLCGLMAFSAAASAESTDTLTIADVEKISEYYVEPFEEGKKVYYAQCTFEEIDGVLWGKIKYTNFRGTIDDGIVRRSTDPAYLVEILTKGTFYSNEMDFTIRISEEHFYVQWGSSEYVLDRYDGDPTELKEKPRSFRDKKSYQTITESISENLGKERCGFAWDDDSYTLTCYVALGKNTRVMAANGKITEQLNSVIDALKSYCTNIQSALDIGARPDIMIPVKTSCVFMLVETLDPNGYYTPNDRVAEIKNGQLVWSAADEGAQMRDIMSGNSGNSGSSSSSGSGKVTMGQKNALASAKSYLEFMAFSKSGLIKQLEYEGYTKSEAEYAVNHCGADWYEQAVKSAKSYLSLMSFSRKGLIEQLEFEGFTHEQAVYGVKKNGY